MDVQTKHPDSNSPALDSSSNMSLSGATLNRRHMLVTLLGSLAASSLSSGCSRTELSPLRSPNTEQLYGTTTNPHFRVREDAPRHKEVLTYRADFLERLTSVDLSDELEQESLASIDTLEKTVAQIRELLRKEPTGSTPSSSENTIVVVDGKKSEEKFLLKASFILEDVRRAKNYLDRLASDCELRKATEDTFRILVTKSGSTTYEPGTFKNLQERFGPPETFLRNLVKTLTNNPLPEKVSITIRPIDKPTLLGFSVAKTQSIVAQDDHYGVLALVLAHEAGHLMALHGEYADCFPASKDSCNHVSYLEEACAFAFQAVAAEFIADDPELYLGYGLFCLYKSSLINRFYSGDSEDSKESEHVVGMAYFDAALTVLGSPAKAYNYLSSHDDLSPEMKAVMTSNREMQVAGEEALKLPRAAKVKERLEVLGANLDSLSKELRKAASAIGVPL